MNSKTTRSNGLATCAIIAMIITCGLAAGTASAQANPFVVTFNGVTYDVGAGTSTWNYSLTWNPTDAEPWGLSHFSIQLCETATVVDGSPLGYTVGFDGSLANSDCGLTGYYGIKWNGNSGLVSPGQTIHFSVTVAGLYDVGTVLTASKAGTHCNLNTVSGPNLDCTVIDHPLCGISPSNAAVCAGQSATFNGFAGGGKAPYTFAWTGPNEFTSTNQSITVTNAGKYTLVVTDAIGQVTQGCEANLTVNDLPEPASKNYEFCEGSPVELDAGVSGIEGGAWTYLWSTGATTQKITVDVEGSYSVTVRNANGCVGTATHAVVMNHPPALRGAVVEICLGGEYTFDAGLFPEGWKWEWSGPIGILSTDRYIIVRAAGDYILKVTTDKGCVATATYTLKVNELPTPQGSTGAVCAGGEYTFDAGAGYKGYAWAGPGGFTSSAQTIKVGVAGTYTVTVTNATDCVKTADHVLTVYELPTPQGSTGAVCAGGEYTFDAGPGYKGYAWVGPNGFTSSAQTIKVGVAGTYTVTVTNATDCVKTADHVLTVYELPTPQGSTGAVCAGGEYTFDAGAGYKGYAWAGPGG
ncbi:MAG: hypothetical protein WC538_10310, partial [Thermoanaerobaculia bacterium]